MFEQINELVGRAIRDVRTNKLDLSQEELAKRVGMSRPSIANIESGRQQISVVQLMHFSNVLGVSPLALLPIETPKNDQSYQDLLKDVEPDIRAWVDSL